MAREFFKSNRPPAAPSVCVIGEVGLVHDGSLGTAHCYIDAIADAGADAVKFQTHIAEAESTPQEPFRVHFSRQDASRYDYWKRTEFTEEQWAGLAHHAAERGLMFLSTPFSVEAVELLQRVGVPAWKVGSGEIRTLPMLRRMAATGKPLLISTGMASWAEIDETVSLVRETGLPFALFQCTSAYPCPPEKVGLNVLQEMRGRYGCPVGLSDHSGSIYAGLAAATLGAELLEVHVTLSRRAFGPDVPASLTVEELASLVQGVRAVEKMLTHPVDKDALAGEFGAMRTMFSKSLVPRRDLPQGAVVSEDDLTMKKPGTGIPAARLAEFIGRRLRRPVQKDELLQESDFDIAGY
jgi:N-acetylneuraminate synthase